ncbi:MAG: alpha-L-arabinofuranosidase C-terminal domain-containing protein [Chloroflexota bacterium]|jgi:alpha-N-arabinofuranosidase|nr:alpha-L-arabinofuranosidase C-terminal domain-containing protein [Chloroflexota bacterium]MDP6757311.1 alpha-L-arabinofuranosidase C-terminal domain-containing protein [Chloroflexota bacterium]
MAPDRNETDPATLTVHLDRPLGKINPFIYGTNIEHLEDLVYGGLWGELLEARKFAGHDGGRLPNRGRRRGRGLQQAWRGEFDDEANFGLVAPWDPVAPTDQVYFVHDNTTFYSGRQSQRIDLLAADDDYHGIGQGGLEIAAGTDYAARVVLQIEGAIDSVVLRLSDAAGENGRWNLLPDRPAGDFTTYEGVIRSERAGPSSFELVARGQGRLWVGAVSLMRADAAADGGLRSDIGAKIVESGLKMLRWPGGNFASDYFWMEGIGPLDRRPTRLNGAWNEYEPNDVGTHEFLDYCERLGMAPFVCVNTGSGSVEDAAAWVEYCNGPPDSEWGRVRAGNGREQPWNVHYWSLGNEMWGDFQVGHVDPETYAVRALEFAAAMKQADPSIHLAAVGHVRNVLGRWNELVSSAVSGQVEAIAVHYYNFNPSVLAQEPPAQEKWDALVAGPKSTAATLRDTIAVIDRHWSADPVPEISYDEWGIREDLRWAPGWKELYLLRDGLNTAGTLQEIQRLAGRISMSHQFAFVNRLGLIDADPNRINETACFQGFKLIANHSQEIALETDADGPTFDTAGLATEPPLQAVPYLDAIGTLSEDGARLSISVVNRHRYDDISARIVLSGGSDPEAAATVHELNGTHALAHNTYEDQGQTWIETSEQELNVDGGTIEHVFPAHSATVLELSIDA